MKRLILVFISMTLISLTTAFAQYTVKGRVVDEAGPIAGVTVLEQGTQNFTSTNIDGYFTLNVSSASTMIEISFLGYKTVVMPANEISVVVMEEYAEMLEETVIIGYGTVKKNDMTGSVVAIKPNDVNRGAIISPEQMLLGKVSGLLITPATGRPGDAATIRIRGAASLNANNDPLIVIDGVPVTGDGGAGMGNPLATVNPNDIESYTVLKDASATAIYGSRASNGVIIITTKKGSGKKFNINYSSSYSLKQNANTLNVMNATRFIEFMKESYPGNEKVANLLGTDNTDWQKQIYRIAFNTDQNISFSGGGIVPYRVSLGYNYDQATLKRGYNQRGNFDVSLAPKLFDDHFSINANGKFIYQHTNWANEGAIGSALSFDPTKPIYFKDANGNIDKSEVSNGYWNWLNSDGSANTMSSVNPLSIIYDWNDGNHAIRSIGNLQLDYKIHGLEDLRLNVNGGYDIARTDGNKYNELGSISAQRSSNDLYIDYKTYNLDLLLEAYADYNHEFRKSNLDAMVGYSWQHNYVSYDESQYYNRSEIKGREEDLYHQVPTNAKEYYLLSFFGRVNYSILSKYLFTVTIREDASSRFSKDNRWGLFPSAAFAWNIAKEPWLENNKTVSALKLRLGWGRTGQQDIGDDYYPYLARYVASNALTMQYFMNGVYSGTLAPLAYNPNLKWETTETFNVGFDFGFLKDRISGSIEAYYRRTYDLLSFIPTPLGSNFGNSIISNIGEMVNKGIEITLNTIPVSTNNWQWTLDGNITFQNTKISKLTAKNSEDYLGVQVGQGMGGTGGYTSLHTEGFAPYTYYLYEQLYDSEGKPVENGLVDRDGDGVITDADRYITGYSPVPRVYYGINSSLRYKNWDFGINLHGATGNYIINKVAMENASSYSDDFNKGYLNNRNIDYLLEGWSNPIENNQKYSDLFVEDGSFIKIDDINLGYTFRLKNNFNMRLAGSVQNVYTFTKYKGLDPEILSADGVDYNIVPRPRLYTLRLSIKF